MGQAQSDGFDCNEDGEQVEDIADSELNHKEASDNTNENNNNNSEQQNIKPLDSDCKLTTKCTANKIFKFFQPITSLGGGGTNKSDENSPATKSNIRLRGTNKEEQQQQHVRKLSNVSNRNIQLLSLRPRSEKDAYADGLRSRRRSSLINLILGAPSSGPKFSDDLCSLSSHMSELCNFGIEFFPDGFSQHLHRRNNNNATNGSTSSSLRIRRVELDDLSTNLELGLSSALAAKTNQGVGGGKFTAHDLMNQQQIRRRSSFGSLSSFQGIQEAPSAVADVNRQHATPEAKRPQLKPQHGQQQQHQIPGEAAGPSKKTRCGEADGNGDTSNVSPIGGGDINNSNKNLTRATSNQAVSPTTRKQHFRNRHPTLTSTLASIDLMSSFEKHDISNLFASTKNTQAGCAPTTTFKSAGLDQAQESLRTKMNKGRINRNGRVLHRTGSELSLYSSLSANSSGSHQHDYNINNELGDSNYYQYNQFFDENNSSTTAVAKRTPSSDSGKQKKRRSHRRNSISHIAKQQQQHTENPSKETKSIILMQVCLPFILAGLGNMAAGLVLNRMAKWRAFREVPIFFVLLPSFVGLKGNIEMTLASRLSTLSNLNLLDSGYERRRAYISNLILILSQAIGLSIFASLISILCEFLLGKLETNGEIGELFEIATLVILPSALITATVLSIISSFVVSFAIALASLIQVNPDNLSTLIAALYGDVSCVLTYGLFAELMFSLRSQNIIIWPILILSLALVCYPILLYTAYKFKETTSLALSSMPPMLTGIMVSIGSGAILSLVVGRFTLIALYQPVVNGFGANLIAVQASRVSTWLWCKSLRQASVVKEDQPLEQAAMEGKKIQASLASFTDPVPMSPDTMGENSSASWANSDNYAPLKLAALNILNPLKKFGKLLFWSFSNPSPNSVAAKLLLMMLVPAHTIYFFAIWFLAPANAVSITWQFYLVYISLCLVQVFILLSICEPLMTLLMKNHLDPDVFGITFLMALADLVGTICLTGAFMLLANIGDANAH